MEWKQMYNFIIKTTTQTRISHTRFIHRAATTAEAHILITTTSKKQYLHAKVQENIEM